MTRQLVYRTGERPVIRANWLFDIEVSYGLFSADTTTLLVRELGLEGRGVDKIIAEHATVSRRWTAAERSKITWNWRPRPSPMSNYRARYVQSWLP